MSEQTEVRIRWSERENVSGPAWPFAGIVVEDPDGNRIQDIPLEHTPAIVDAAVGESLTITQFVVDESGDRLLDHAQEEAVRKSLALVVVANEIPKEKREELLRSARDVLEPGRKEGKT